MIRCMIGSVVSQYMLSFFKLNTLSLTLDQIEMRVDTNP